MKELETQLMDAAAVIVNDVFKGTKAAHQRVRKATLEIARIGKEYRKASIAADKKA